MDITYMYIQIYNREFNEMSSKRHLKHIHNNMIGKNNYGSVREKAGETDYKKGSACDETLHEPLIAANRIYVTVSACCCTVSLYVTQRFEYQMEVIHSIATSYL